MRDIYGLLHYIAAEHMLSLMLSYSGIKKKSKKASLENINQELQVPTTSSDDRVGARFVFSTTNKCAQRKVIWVFGGKKDQHCCWLRQSLVLEKPLFLLLGSEYP